MNPDNPQVFKLTPPLVGASLMTSLKPLQGLSPARLCPGELSQQRSTSPFPCVAGAKVFWGTLIFGIVFAETLTYIFAQKLDLSTITWGHS